MKRESARLVLFFCIMGMLISGSGWAVVYVDVNASGSNDGTSWANAYNSIQSGINDADAPTTDIWVADGTYYEGISIISSSIVITATLDVITITIPITTTIQGIHLYGGFEGYGGAEETEREQRNWVNNVTTIDGTGYYHAVYIDDVTSTVLDGFTITGGNANGSSPNDMGAGILCGGLDNTNIIDNCLITGNQAASFGGGICLLEADPIINHCRIIDNFSGQLGGGMGCVEASPQIINTTFCANTAVIAGGAIACLQCAPLIINCTISNNKQLGVFADTNAFPVFRNTIFEQNDPISIFEGFNNSDISLEYCLFYNNQSGGAFYDSDYSYVFQDWEMNLLNANVPEAKGNITGDPLFVDKNNCDLHIQPCSAAIDEATSDTAPMEDLDWNERPVDYPGRGRDGAGEGFDIGAYELQETSPTIAVSPLYINFGDQSVNQGPTAPQTITIWNNGSAALVFDYISLGDDDNFGFASPPDTSDLGICMSRTIEVVFDPTQIATFTTTVEIATNDPISSTVSIELEGNGLNLPPEAVICDDAVPYALDFDGSNDHVDCGNDESLMPDSAITVEAWINADVWRTDAWRGTIVEKTEWIWRGNRWRNLGFVLRAGRNSWESFGRAEFMIGNDKQDWVSAISPETLNEDQWYHIAGVYDGNNVKVYIDGVLAATVDDGADPGIASSNIDLWIGNSAYDTSRRFNGLIDEVRIWNYGKSQAEIQETMAEILEGNEPGLSGYWRFDEGTGNTAFDSTGNNNDGALVGMPDWTTEVPDVHDYTGFMTTDENTDTTVPLCGEDPDNDDLTAWITLLPESGNGQMYQFAGDGPVRGAAITTTPTLVTDPGLRVVFAPFDTPMNYNTLVKWKVNDGLEDSANQATEIIRVLDNDPPELVINVATICPKGATVIVTSDTLSSTDYEDLPENIQYTITQSPMHGDLHVGAMELGNGDTFTQADIDAGDLSYSHNSIGMDPDQFNFDLMDGAGLISGTFTHTIEILFTPAPQVYVDLNSPGPALDGGSWASAHHSIEIGVLDAVALGLTEVWVADSSYLESVDMRSNVDIYGGFEGYGGAEETELVQRDWVANICVIDGTGNDRTVTMQGISNSLVHGFVITGTGVTCENTDDTIRITSCTLEGNTAQFGGGIYCHQSSPVITDCVITENTATREGGGIYARNNSSPLLVNCEITSNTAEEVGGGVYSRNSASPTLLNCVIALNSAAQGGALYCQNSAEPIVINATISGNMADQGGGVYALSNAAPVLVNTIFEDNNNYAIYEGDDNTNIGSVEACLFWNNPDGAYYDRTEGGYTDAQVEDMNADLPEAMDNITGDPKFADKENADFHLTACSAALDQGAKDMAPLFDKDDAVRPVDLPDIGKDGEGEGFDIGAYELQILAPKIKVSPNPLNFGGQLVNQGPANPMAVTIFNEGTLPLEIFSITLQGSSDFTFVQDPVTTGLTVCEGFEVGIGFDPSSTGLITATLMIESNDPEQPVVEVEILGMGLNTPPVAGIPGPGGDQFALNTDEDTVKLMMLTGWDPDGDAITFWVTQIPAEGYGEIYQYQGPGLIRGPRIGSVPAQVTDPLMRLIFVPSNRSASYGTTLLWKVNDGYEDSLNQGTFTITVQADDDPALLVNNSMTVNENSTTPLSPDDLLATGDEPVSFRMDSVPLNGQILLNSSPLGLGDTFTQVDVGLGRVAYTHDGSETVMDAFEFSFQDENSGWITGNDFMITIVPVDDPPVLVQNNVLDAVQGRRRVIPATHLLVTDEESPPSEIVFTIVTTPAFGDLNLNNAPLGIGGTFTQADIDAGLVTYRNTGSGLDPDSFTFTYSDGNTVLGPATFNLNIILADTRGAWWMLR